MARTATTARTSKSDESLEPRSLLAKVIWAGLAGLWVFLAVTLASFDSADWPSHVVAIHNHPPANLCGAVGAVIAYWAYAMFGIGAWVLMLGFGGALIADARGFRVSHAPLRLVGLLIMAMAAATLHRVLFTEVTILAGTPAGLLGEYIAGMLAPRFSLVGSALVLVAALSIGAIVAADHLVFALPRFLWRTYKAIRAGSRATARVAGKLRGTGKVAETDLEDDIEEALADTQSKREPWWKRHRATREAAKLDADLGGVGATGSG
jgi:hypothetical protein